MKTSSVALRAYQREANERTRWFYDEKEINDILWVKSTGLGKAQPLDAKILTPLGWTTMGEVKVGDLVIGSDGRPTQVVGVFPQGVRDVYTVKFSDGTQTRCCEEHLWAVQTKSSKNKGFGFRVKELRDLMGDLRDGSGSNKWFVPVVEPVEFAKKDVPIDPYVLGCLIGDGGFAHSSVYLFTDDEFIVREVEKRLPEGAWVTHYDRCTYRIAQGNTGRAGGVVGNVLRDLGLMGLTSEMKFIPDLYKYNSVDVRLALLRGLMDTDGTVRTKDNHTSFCTVSPKLADDVCEIVRSLGGTTRIRTKETIYTYNGERRNGKTAYLVTVNLPFNPFLLPRKARMYRGDKKQGRTKAIVSIERSGREQTQCIAVDAPDHLYVTDDYILTHNTIAFSALPSYFPDLAKFGVLVLVHRDELVFQSVEKMQMVNPGLRIGIEKAEYHCGPEAQVVVASVQTLGQKGLRRLRRLMRARPFGIVIVDEAHHCSVRSQYDRILNALGLGSDKSQPEMALLPNGQRRLLVGVTATPNRNDKQGLSHFFSEIAINLDLKWAIEQGYLTDIEHWSIETGTDLSGVRTRAGDFSIDELDRAANTKHRNSLIVSAYRKHALGKKGIAFCTSVGHAYALAEVFKAAGIEAAAIDGTTDKDVRKELLRRHEDPSDPLMVLCNFGVLTEGYDGLVHCVMMARPTKSQPLYIQMVGRGLRTVPPDLGNLETQAERLQAIEESEKPACILLDFVDSGHDLVTVPSLFGCSPKLNGEGRRMVRQVVEYINNKIKENPWNAEAIQNAESFEEVEVESRRINVWGVAKSFHALRGITDLKWMSLPGDVKQIEIPASENNPEIKRQYVRLEPDALGHYRVVAIRPREWDREAGRWIPEERREGPVFRSVEEAIRACDQKIKSDYSDVLNLMRQHAEWRMGSPSEGQLSYLRALGIDTKDVKSKGVASDLISAAKQMGLKPNYKRFSKKRAVT